MSNRTRRRALLLTLLLLAAGEGLARTDWIWRAVPRSDAGVVDVLEREVLAEATRPVVVAMGSSRVRDAVLPRAIEAELGLPRGAVLNLGLTSGTPFDALTLYRRNRDVLRHTELLLVGVEDWYLNGAVRPTDRDRRFASLAERWTDWRGEPRISLLVGWLARTYDARGAIRGVLRATLAGGARPLQVADDGRLAWRKRADPETGPASVDVVPQVDANLGGWSLRAGRAAQLDRLRALAAEDGVQVRLLAVPWRAIYVAEARTRHPEAWRDWRAWVAAQPRPPLLHDAELGLPPTAFIDYGHLARSGAERYSRALAEVVRPLLDR